MNSGFKQCVNAIVFKYFNEKCPNYLNEVFDIAVKKNFQLRGNFQKSKCPFRETNTGQLALSYIGLTFWNNSQTHSGVLKILIPSSII